MNVTPKHDSFAERLGHAVAETFDQMGFEGGSESPEAVGRRIAISLASENLAREADAGPRIRDMFTDSAHSLGLSSLEAAGLLGMKSSTFAEWQQGRSPRASRSDDEILHLAATLNQIEFVMGCEAGRAWLSHPCVTLSSERPADLLKAGESELVAEILDEIYLQLSATAQRGSPDH